MVLVMVRMLMMDRMLGAMGMVLIATVMLMLVVVMAVIIMLMFVTVLVAAMMGVVRVRRGGRSGRGRRHGWLPFSLIRHTTATTQRCGFRQHTPHVKCQIVTYTPLCSPAV